MSIFICSRVSLVGSNIRSEPKYITFLSQLLLLFQFCHFCKTDNPEVEVTESGTNVTVKTRCPNEKCNKEFTWHSQPFLPGSLIHAGNFLLPLAVVLAGGSATKMVNTFGHMGIRCISLKTFFKHQRVCVMYVYCNGLEFTVKSLFEIANIEFVFDFKPVGYKI
jgi:hypothetical protein